MRSPNISGRSCTAAVIAGFTLIETLVALGVLTFLAGFGTVAGIQFYRGYFFQAERDTLVSVLERARMQAMTNTYQSPIGVSIHADQYTVFAGATFATRDVTRDWTVPAATQVIKGGATEIVFEQLTGNAISPGVIVLTGIQQVATLSIDPIGRVDW